MTLRLRIAGIIVELRCASPLRVFPAGDPAQQEEARLATFLYQGKKRPDITVHLRLVDRLPGTKGLTRVFDARTVTDNASNWTLWRTGGRYIFRSDMPGRVQHMASSADLTRVHGWLSQEDRKERGSWTLSEIIFYFLEVHLLRYLCRTGKGFFLHASAVADTPARGYAFAGRSGCGKSTMSRLWYAARHAAVLNDERVIVRPVAGKFMVYRTPWYGEFSEYFDTPAYQAQLKAVFMLSHAARHTVGRLDAAAGRQQLYQVVMWPFWDPQGYRVVASLADELLKKVPLYSLGFAKNDSVVKAVRATQR